jgi:mannose-6-phosphate isomerase
LFLNLQLLRINLRQFISQPYQLKNKIQHYDWGEKNTGAFIPGLLGIEAEPGVPYAELWIGTHPKAPSEIEFEGEYVPLNKVIEEFNSECLGEYVSAKFSGKFPFLLKVLSAANALSIQTHPNKVQAVKLHAVDPANYPDDNHKPEIAIAIDSLVAIAGFRPVEEIISNLRRLPELNKFIGDAAMQNLLYDTDIMDAEKSIKNLYGIMMRKADDMEKLSACISGIRNRLLLKEQLAVEEDQFLKQFALYGNDIGLLSFFFFNIVSLKPGQAIFTDAGVPHAYIVGNIIECMANSDNVVRAGLTAKFKDVNTLLEILRYDFRKYDTINGGGLQDAVKYKTPASEFEVTRFNKTAGYFSDCSSGGKPSVWLIISGKIEVRWFGEGAEKSLSFSKGDSFFIPACLTDYEIKAVADTQYFVVDVP